MAYVSEEFLSGDDLEDLYKLLDDGFLDDDNDLNQQVNDIINENVVEESVNGE